MSTDKSYALDLGLTENVLDDIEDEAVVVELQEIKDAIVVLAIALDALKTKVDAEHP